LNLANFFSEILKIFYFFSNILTLELLLFLLYLADLLHFLRLKNLGNNAIFSKVFGNGLRYYMILEKHPEILQKTGYFPMWFFIKYLQNYRNFIGRKKSQGAA
jgi:hypothetical protein